MTEKTGMGKYSAQRTWGQIPHVYHQFCREIRRHLKRRGWSLWELDDAAGWPDGYAGKSLNPASPSGRVSGYAMLDLALAAVAGRGFRILVVPADFDATDATAVQALLIEQDDIEAERIAGLVEFAAHTNRIPKIAAP